jgi:hypothetical protein
LVTAENYIIREISAGLSATMLKLRAGPSPYHTAVAMVGARAGDRVLMIGADDADLAAHVALVTGLSGDVQRPITRPAPRPASRLPCGAWARSWNSSRGAADQTALRAGHSMPSSSTSGSA